MRAVRQPVDECVRQRPRSGRRGRSCSAVAELRLFAPVIVIVEPCGGTATTSGADGKEAATCTVGGGRRRNVGRRRGECDASLLSTGWGNLWMVDWWGLPKSAVFLCRRKRGQGESSVFPLFPPVSPLSAVSVSHPLEGFSHLAPVEPRALSCLIFWVRWRTTLRFWRRRSSSCYHCEGGDPCLPSGVVVEARGERISASSWRRREMNRPLRGRGVWKTTPTSSPSRSNARARARARERVPPSSSRVLRQPRELKTHGYRVSRVENPRVSSRNEDSLERQFWSIAITRPTQETTYLSLFWCIFSRGTLIKSTQCRYYKTVTLRLYEGTILLSHHSRQNRNCNSNLW